MGLGEYRSVLKFAGLPLLAVAVLVGVVVIIARDSDSTPAPTPAPEAEPIPTPTEASDNRGVRPETGYSKVDLDAWSDKIWDTVPGIRSSGVDGNRIVFGMVPLRGVREAFEAAVAAANIPRDAVGINIGCAPFGLGQSPKDGLLRDIHASVEVAPQVAYGETVRMKLTLRNVSDKPVGLFYGHGSDNFVVTTPDGEDIWHWTCAKAFITVMLTTTLEPGDVLDYTGEWEQVNYQGEAVPPGVYTVHGAFHLSWSDSGQFVHLFTPPHQLEVLGE